MTYHNPELQRETAPPKNAPIQPDAHDFVETSDVPDAPPEEGKLPVWLYLVCGFALFLAGSSFTGFVTFGQGLYDQGPGGPTLASAKGPETAVASTDPMVIGKKVYGGNCANCHQASGEGQPGSYPPLGGSALVIGDKLALSAVMLHGLQGPLTGVRGGTYGTQQMPAWATVLSDEKMAAVMTYIRGSWGNKADAVKPDEVAATRTKLASQTAAYTEADLQKLAQQPAAK
jgi:mono/diheme cytochrome c family protein